MSALSTFAEASTSIARLDLRFGGEDVTEAAKFKELRLFRCSDAYHVRSAVDRACRHFVRRPNIDELKQLIGDEQFGRRPAADDEITDPAEVPARIADLRRLLEAGGDEVRIVAAGQRFLAAAVRDPEVGVVDVRWAEGSWSCSCRQELACHHIAAVRQLTEAVVA